jgi:hypothetical protein
MSDVDDADVTSLAHQQIDDSKAVTFALKSNKGFAFNKTGGHSQAPGWIIETCLSELPMARSSRLTLSSSLVSGSLMCNVWMCDTPKCSPRGHLINAVSLSVYPIQRNVILLKPLVIILSLFCFQRMQKKTSGVDKI